MKMIFFDAAGTLIHPAEAVGEVYSRIGAKYGFLASPRQLDAGFRQALKTQGPMVALQGENSESGQQDWWYRLVAGVWGVDGKDLRFRSYFNELYSYYEKSDAWSVYDDVRPVLHSLREKGYRLGVISNFDSRLHKVLAGLDLTGFFESIVVSMEAGAAKPERRIFELAAEQSGIKPENAIHIGDRPDEDFQGALNAGLQAVLLDREGIADLSNARLRSLHDFVNNLTFILNE